MLCCMCKAVEAQVMDNDKPYCVKCWRTYTTFGQQVTATSKTKESRRENSDGIGTRPPEIGRDLVAVPSGWR